MGGFFGVASKRPCNEDIFYGVDYHSHLGTRRGGIATIDTDGFHRAIHNIENTPFRTKLEKDLEELTGNMGIGCISDYEPQPLLIQSHLGSFAITTVGRINNDKQIMELLYDNTSVHFQEMSAGQINATEMVAALICKKNSILEGLSYVQEILEGSMSILILAKEGIYASRDKLGRTPIVIGKDADGYCCAFESFSYINLGYTDYKELGPAEIDLITADEVKVLKAPGKDMKICSFLWVYYGYPTASYEGVNVEHMRNECGKHLAKRDAGAVEPDLVAGVPDSGVAHAIGYSNYSGIPYARPFVKYTPTWPRSFMPTIQSKRNLIAHMKLIPIKALIEHKKLLLIDDSIVRGTQLRETTQYLYDSGADEVHIRTACPPLLFGCKYVNFSRSKSEMDLITRRVVRDLEGEDVSKETLQEYANPDSEKHKIMVDEIAKRLNFTSLRFNRLDDMLEAISIDPCKVCTYCFSGEE